MSGFVEGLGHLRKINNVSLFNKWKNEPQFPDFNDGSL